MARPTTVEPILARIREHQFTSKEQVNQWRDSINAALKEKEKEISVNALKAQYDRLTDEQQRSFLEKIGVPQQAQH